MKRYKINRNKVENLPSDETVEKFKSYPKFQVKYEDAVKKNKLPLYKNPKMFLFILILALVAYIIATEVNKESSENEVEPTEESR